jgi:hypothetical protein
MHERCRNPNHNRYYLYGGRGIAVCVKWKSFDAFVEDMGECPAGLTLDRIDNDKGYSKENCRWITRAEQANNRRDLRLITYLGRTQNLNRWRKELGMAKSTVQGRLNRGLPPEEIFKIMSKDRA